jgi:hypothetical protein
VLEDESVNYKPPEMDLSTWQMSITASGAEGAQFIFWILSSTKKVFVPKDPKWLSDHLPHLKAAWDEVLLHRAAGTLPPPPPSKVVILDI